MTAKRDLRIFVYQLSFAEPFPFETHSAVLAALKESGLATNPRSEAVRHPRRRLALLPEARGGARSARLRRGRRAS